MCRQREVQTLDPRYLLPLRYLSGALESLLQDVLHLRGWLFCQQDTLPLLLHWSRQSPCFLLLLALGSCPTSSACRQDLPWLWARQKWQAWVYEQTVLLLQGALPDPLISA